MFITFEGIDGCGKSTQIDLLVKYLQDKGQETIITREPGGTEIGKQIRNILLSSNNNKLSNLTEVFLFAADRAQHIEEIIKPALNQNKLVICDRYVDSTIAYQIGGRKLDENLISTIISYSTRDLNPNKTFLLDISPETGLRRARKIKTADRFERETISFYERIRKKYLELAAKNSQRYVVFDSEKFSIAEIHAQIINTFETSYNKSTSAQELKDH
ncbi:MAG: dTMP kinase [Candidatus Margulisiibacteriota bacterium]|nr:MAG: dTMP kinase [Candidatus Margulisbacteria bacterium GWD2_39_127]OGI05433.1 MAG: dTMP kinase [Candidatus Margulisbacteria bacterium GWF2_38_17]OGI07829.1 MAG: dTMP kinase [Candidatus Margulisbacteria bacterium GWE2_39_32]PZM80114.1 MAG: dTMP kinase [Candidatus Margulisiibacteriota bacterium]HAR62620.1 dTMP kinase [Candidatus Margulisiibacteriota bacterium]